MHCRLLGSGLARAGLVITLVLAGLTVPVEAQDVGPIIMTRPQPRQNHSAFELGRGGKQMVILGGKSDTGALAEEWIREGGEWSYRTTAFPARYDQATTVLGQCGRQRVIMTGGLDDMGDAFDGIWRRDRRTRDWVLIGRNEHVRRSGHTALPGPRGRSILIFGGERDGQKLSDTVRMTFNRNGFPELDRLAANAIPARDHHTMTWVPNIKRFVVQGGRGEGDVALADSYYWEPRTNTWNRMSDAPFSARYNHTIYWDKRAKRLIAIGGTDGTEQLSDAWAGRPRLDQRHVLIDWVKLERDAVGAREGQSAVYNARRKKAIIFGGLGPAGLLGDTHKVQVERTFFGTPTVQTYLVDDFIHDGDPVMSNATGSPADFDQNGTVDMEDIMSIYAAWGVCSNCPQDLDGDGAVRAGDVAEALAQLGTIR